MGDQSEIDLELVGSLLALIAHDLRNPLSALHSNLGFLSTVLQEPDEDVTEAIADGLVSCDGLTHIIDNLDLFGHTLRGARQPSGLALSVVALVRDVAQRCQSVAESHGLELNVDYRQMDSELEAWGNRDLLARALANLVRNSLQLSPGGSVVEIRAQRTDSGAEIYVFDTGTTLKAAVQEPFSARGQIGLKGSGDGRYSRGMGLLSAQLAATAAGASVGVVQGVDGFTNGFVLKLRAAGPESLLP